MKLRLLFPTLPAFLLLTSLAAGQSTAPSTQPVAADQSTPRGTIKLLYSAEATSDGKVFRQVMLTTSSAQEKMADAIADKTDASREFQAALFKKFPEVWQNVDPDKKGIYDLPRVLDLIDHAIELIDGDTAKVQMMNSQAVPLTLKRSNGKWLLPMDVFVQGEQPDNTLEQNAHQIEIQVKAMRQGADDVLAGKYKSAGDAEQDVKQRMFTAALDDHAAATQQTKP